MSNKGTEEIAAALEEAIAGDVEPSTTEEPTEEKASEEQETTTPQSGEKGPVPYERFAEVISEKNTFKEQLEALEAEKDEISESLRKTTDLVSAAQSDVDTLNRVRSAIRSDDQRVVSAVEMIDKYLKGELEEIVEDEKLEPEQVAQKTQDLLKKTQANLENQTADIRTDLIAQRADALADKWLEALPNEYNDADRELISDIWANSVNWDDIEENPDLLDQELAGKFQAAIDKYGVPRGALLNPEDVEFVEETTTPEGPTPEEELRELLGDRDFSAFKKVTGPGGKETVTPEVGDDDFAAVIGKALKLANKS